MKKALIGTALLAASALGTTLFLGQQVQGQYQQWLGELSQTRGLKAQSLGFDGGLFGASARTKVSLTDAALVQLLSEHGLPSSLVLEHHFQFWPWQVVGDTQPDWGGEGKHLKALFDDEAPLAIHSVHRLWGSASVEGRLGYLQWQDKALALRIFPLSFQFDGKASDWQRSLNWNGLEFKDGQGRLVLSGVKLDRQGQENQQGYQAQVGAITYSDGGFWGLTNLRLNGEAQANKGRLKRHSHWQADEVKYNAERFSGLGLDLTLDNLDERALDKTLGAALTMAVSGREDTAATDAFLDSLQGLLAKGGKLAFKELHLGSDTGELAGEGYLALKAGKLDSLAQFMALADGKVELKVPKQLGGLEPIDADTLTVLSERGWVREEGNQILLRFQVAGQQLTLNQKPLLSAL